MGLSPLKVMKINFKPKYLDIKNCKALLPKDEFNIVVQQVDKYLEEINNVDSDQVGLVDTLIKQNKKSVGKPSRLILSQNIIDVCLSVLSISGDNKVKTLNGIIGVLTNEPSKLHLEFNNEKGTYWKVIIPIQFLLKGWGDADKGYKSYHHTIAENITCSSHTNSIWNECKISKAA